MSKHPLYYYFSKARKEPIIDAKEDIRRILAHIPDSQTNKPSLLLWSTLCLLIIATGAIFLFPAYFHRGIHSPKNQPYAEKPASPQHEIDQRLSANRDTQETAIPEAEIHTARKREKNRKTPIYNLPSENTFSSISEIPKEELSTKQNTVIALLPSPLTSSIMPRFHRHSEDIFSSPASRLPSQNWYIFSPDSSPSLGFSVGIGFGVNTSVLAGINTQLRQINFPTMSEYNTQVDMHGFLLYRRWKLGVEVVPYSFISSSGKIGAETEEVQYGFSHIAVLGGYTVPFNNTLSVTLGYKISFDSYELIFSDADYLWQGASDWNTLWQEFSTHSSLSVAGLTLSKSNASFHPVFELNYALNQNFILNVAIEGSFNLQPHKDWSINTFPNEVPVYGGNVNFEPHALTIKTNLNFQSFPF